MLFDFALGIEMEILFKKKKDQNYIQTKIWQIALFFLCAIILFKKIAMYSPTLVVTP